MGVHATQHLHLPHAPSVNYRFFPFMDSVELRWAQILELVHSKGWSSVFRELFFLNRTAIVVEKDLSDIKERADVLANANLRVVEIDENMLSSNVYHFAVRSRGLKAPRYLERGYGGMALVRGTEVIGDTWYVAPDATTDPSHLHADLQRFGFKSWTQNHAYTFDIFVAPEERKGGVAPAFQNRSMLILRSKGYTKGFGFYWADNIPAHWCTRVTNKWKKLREVRMSRFLIFTKVVSRAETPVLRPVHS